MKTLLISALRLTFDSQFPNADFRGVHVDQEYPVDKQAYPGIWVDFTEDEPLKRIGVDHHDVIPGGLGEPDTVSPYSRWTFSGSVSMTVVALTSLERDRLFDEVVKVFAFGEEDSALRQFRDYIENNDLIALNIDFDTISVGGNSAAQGTPWGTDEMLYEVTLNVSLTGEFVGDRATATLVPLSQIIVDAPQVYLTPDAAPRGPVSDSGGSWV